MSSFSDRNKKKGSGLGKAFKIAVFTLAAYASYQFYLPTGTKDAIAGEANHLTHTKLGNVFDAVTPPWQKAEAAPAAAAAPATAPDFKTPAPGK